jgi:hypothetical protein
MSGEGGMNEYRAPTGMPEDWGLYPKGADTFSFNSLRPQPFTPMARAARFSPRLTRVGSPGFHGPKINSSRWQRMLSRSRRG